MKLIFSVVVLITGFIGLAIIGPLIWTLKGQLIDALPGTNWFEKSFASLLVLTIFAAILYGAVMQLKKRKKNEDDEW